MERGTSSPRPPRVDGPRPNSFGQGAGYRDPAAIELVRGRPRRSLSLRVQLSLAFVVVALLSVVVVAFWARQITALEITEYHERIRRGEVPWISDQPILVREGFVRAIKPPLFVASQRLLLANFNRSLWFAGGTAGLLAVLAGLVLGRRASPPLQGVDDAVARGGARNPPPGG